MGCRLQCTVLNYYNKVICPFGLVNTFCLPGGSRVWNQRQRLLIRNTSARFECQVNGISSIHSTNRLIQMASTSSESLKSNVQVCKLPEMTQVESPAFNQIFSDGVKKLVKLFQDNDYELRLCGGAVRDILSDQHPKDLDFATTATPEEMIAMFRANDVRLFNESGWSHGTVSCRISEENFEVTTLRIDRVTDGRHAEVEFTKDWMIDASRRDLTFNSLFLTLDGVVVDYFHGRYDLEEKRVLFVNDPVCRIQEDYLRILRYFRFFCRIADENSSHDTGTLEAIRQNAHGLSRISGERLWTELSLIFCTNQFVSVLRVMHQCGLFTYLGLPSDPNFDRLDSIQCRSRHLEPSFMIFVACLLDSEEDLLKLRSRLKFSNVLNNIALFIIRHRGKIRADIDMQPVYEDMLVEQYRKDRKVKVYFNEFLKYCGDVQAMNFFADYVIPNFPVDGNVLKERIGLKKKAIGEALGVLFKRWQCSRYTLTAEELLKNIESNDCNL